MAKFLYACLVCVVVFYIFESLKNRILLKPVLEREVLAEQSDFYCW